MLKVAICLTTLMAAMTFSPADTLSQSTLPSSEKQTGQKSPPEKTKTVTIADLIRLFDLDGDGKLNASERNMARTTILSDKRATSAQVSKDSSVSNREAFIKKYDMDGDGKLNESERAAAKAALTKNAKGGSVDREQLLKKFDLNKDGRLNETERTALKKYIQQVRNSSNKAAAQTAKNNLSTKNVDKQMLLKMFDANQNGILEPQEREQARTTILRRRAATTGDPISKPRS